MFNADEGVLASEEKQAELRELVAPAEAVFLDAKLEADMVELSEEEAREMLEMSGQDESGLDKLARVGLLNPGSADLFDGWPEGIARLDDLQGRHGTAGGGRDPLRFRTRLH